MCFAARGLFFIYTTPVNIVTAYEMLAVEGLEGDHDHIIETVLSKLFLRGDFVHKIYKHREGDFADLTDKETRRAYVSEDFFWNNAMASDIYLELRHVQRNGDIFIHVDECDAEDWYIVMKKVDTSRDLMRILERGVPGKKELEGYARTLRERLTELTKHRRDSLALFFSAGETHVKDEIRAVFPWAYTATPILTHDEVAHIEKLIASTLEHCPYWNTPIESMSVVVDNNPENILFLDEGVSFIDVMPPKDAWRVHDRYFSLCRTSADISALAGSDYTEVLHDTYAEEGDLPPRQVRAVYEIAAALIQVPYRKMIGRDDLALRYADYLRTRVRELEAMVGFQSSNEVS